MGLHIILSASKVGGVTHHNVVLQSGAVQDPHVKEVITNPAPLRFSLPQSIIRSAVGLWGQVHINNTQSVTSTTEVRTGART